jgi:hypothetical protein
LIWLKAVRRARSYEARSKRGLHGGYTITARHLGVRLFPHRMCVAELIWFHRRSDGIAL